ncbi:MAG TPA: PQQ-binding-like beta-propeller repeat protein [Vicinamibacterales bacterium]|nr:PQQ-binding-like beta-propeller repeat protein [Vicinamibacterales bacterium]
MRNALTPIIYFVSAIMAGLLAHPSAQPQNADRYWPQWRGPQGTGVSRTATPPTEWSESKNVRWKIEIPGRGSGTPVIWGDRLYVTSAVPVGVEGAAQHAPRGAQPRIAHKYVVLAIDRKTGKTVWERTAREEAPHEASHAENGTWASSSAIVDGEHVIASFESRGYYAFDLSGNPVWQTDLGDKRMRSQFGEGSTPALHGNTLVIVWDHQGESVVVALDKRTGKELWRKTRTEIDTWATPLITPVDGKPQVVVPAMNKITSYDLATGEVVWESAGLTMNPIPSPVTDGAMAYLMSGFRGNSLKAIRLADAKGDITGTPAVAWSLDRDTPYVPSPLLYDGILYFLKTNNGLLTALDAKTGQPHYQAVRIDAVPNVFSSPVGAAGRVYIAGREGATVVLRHGTKLDVIAVNELTDGFDASPALVDGELYLRGYRYLYCIATN